MPSEPNPRGASGQAWPRNYREAAPYVRSFLAELSLQASLPGRLEVEVVASGLGEEEVRMLR